MACMTSITSSITSYEEPIYTSSTKQRHPTSEQVPQQRRRHSSYHIRQWDPEQDNIHQLVDRFLIELGRRLDFLEDYGTLDLDAGVESAWSTLQQVRESCSHVSNDMLDAGWRRADILVSTLEDRYKGALARKETMGQKVQEGVRLMETMIEDFECRAYAMRDSHLAQANELLDSGRRRFDSSMQIARDTVEEGLEKARRAKLNLKIKIDSAMATARAHGLITYADLPEPWKCNPHILRGYRFNTTPSECVRSLFGISNELFNIWSHLLGFLIVLGLAFYIYPSGASFSSSSKSDIFVAAIFFAAACKCLVCSTLWHTMASISNQHVMERFACVDYTGISLLVATSSLTITYTAFYCEPVSRWTYMTTTTILGICGTIAPWHPTFNRMDFAWLRVLFYVALGMTGVFPVFQLAATRGLTAAIYFYAPITKSVLVYITGAILYASKVPERWCPGAFDYVGGSHNIWHVAVLCGILFHYYAMEEFFKMAFDRALTGGCSTY